jgi:hypothetical protein
MSLRKQLLAQMIKGEQLATAVVKAANQEVRL